MKQKFKLVAAFLCGAVFFSGISYAATGDLIARPTNFKVVVDGKEQKFNNKPVTIDNTTYLPVRETAQAVGKNVEFNNGVITLGESNDTTKDTGQSTNSTNSSTPAYKKLPITVSKGGYTLTLTSMEYAEHSINFHVTVENANNDWAYMKDDNPLGVNTHVPGKKSSITGSLRGAKEENFPERIDANSTIEGVVRKTKPENSDIEHLAIHLRVGLEDFSFYIDVK